MPTTDQYDIFANVDHHVHAVREKNIELIRDYEYSKNIFVHQFSNITILIVYLAQTGKKSILSAVSLYIIKKKYSGDEHSKMTEEAPLATYSTVPPTSIPAPRQRIGNVCPDSKDPKLIISEVLGRGQMGIVYKAMWHNTQVAIKFLNVNFLLDAYESDSKKDSLLNLHRAYLDLMMESTTMAKIEPHENVIEYIGLTGASRPSTDQPENQKFRAIFGDKELEIGVMTRFMPGTKNLEEELRTKSHSLRDLMRISKNIADGMAHIHRAGVIHGDLAARNILISGDRVVVTDFGLAHLVWPNCDALYYVQRGKKIPIRLKSPEFFRSAVDRSVGFGKPSDVWAFGLLINFMFKPRTEDPFPGVSNRDYVLTARSSEPYPFRITIVERNNLSRVARICLLLNQEHRPTFEQLSLMIEDNDTLTEFERVHLARGSTIVKIPTQSRRSSRNEVSIVTW